MSPFTPKTQKHYFLCAAMTLIELLIVVAIIAVLGALLLPVLGKMKDAGNKAQCISNMRMLGTAQLAFAAENNGRVSAGVAVKPEEGYPFGSGNLWQTDILPYLTNTSNATAYSRNKTDFVFNCPSLKIRTLGNLQTTYALSWVLPNKGRNWLGVLARVEQPSRTILMVETCEFNTDYVKAVGQGTLKDVPAFRHGDAKPEDPQQVDSGMGYTHYGRGKANVLFVDGHVDSLSPKDLRHLPPNSLWWPN